MMNLKKKSPLFVTGLVIQSRALKIISKSYVSEILIARLIYTSNEMLQLRRKKNLIASHLSIEKGREN